MSSEELAKRVNHWIRTYHFCGEVTSGRTDGYHYIQFEARTTSTRASSMVTRLKLMVSELVVGPEFEVSKRLIGQAPIERSSLATWQVYVRIFIRKRKQAA